MTNEVVNAALEMTTTWPEVVQNIGVMFSICIMVVGMFWAIAWSERQ